MVLNGETTGAIAVVKGRWRGGAGLCVDTVLSYRCDAGSSFCCGEISFSNIAKPAFVMCPLLKKVGLGLKDSVQLHVPLILVCPLKRYLALASSP
jgi:hypothetical protein